MSPRRTRTRASGRGTGAAAHPTMRVPILFASLCAVGACTATAEPAPRDQLAGVWDRYDSEGVLIDRVTFDSESAFHAFANQGSLLGDFSNVVGSYHATDDRIVLDGTSGDGVAFEIEFSYYANDTQLVRGAYVLDPEYSAEDAVRRYSVYYRETQGGRFHQALDGKLAVTDGGVPSFLTWYTDPSGGTDRTDSGDWEHAPGAMVLDSGLRFEVLDARALGQHDTEHTGIGAPSTWWDTGFIYQRVD